MIAKEAKGNGRQVPLKEDIELPRITELLHQTIEMELLSHQLMFESVPMAGIGLLELEEEEEKKREHTDSQKDNKEKQNPPDWKELGTRIAEYAQGLCRAIGKVPACFDAHFQQAGLQYQKVRVMLVKEGHPPSNRNIVQAPELLHEEKFAYQSERYLLRIYQQVVELRRIEPVIDPQHFRSNVERWRQAAQPELKTVGLERLCLTRVNPRMVITECQLDFDPSPPYFTDGCNPGYTFDDIWQYIDIVEDRKSLYGLRYLKDRRTSPERVTYFFDWNRQVMKLDIVDGQAPYGLQEAQKFTTDGLDFRKIHTHGSTLASTMETLNHVLIMSRADELSVGPDLTEKYRISVSTDLKPFHFYCVNKWTALKHYLGVGTKDVQQLHGIIVQLFRVGYILNRCCIVHQNIQLKCILYDEGRRLLRIDGFDKARVLKNTYPFKIAPNAQEEVQYLTKLHEFEAAEYVKDLDRLDDVIKQVISAFKQLPDSNFYKELQRYLQSVTIRRSKPINPTDNIKTIQQFLSFVSSLEPSSIPPLEPLPSMNSMEHLPLKPLLPLPKQQPLLRADHYP